MSMNVCVVGASGVLGRAVVPMLVRDGHRVLALARFHRAPASVFSSPSVRCNTFDLLSATDGAKLPSLLEGCDAVLHLATAIPSLKEMSDSSSWQATTMLRTVGTRTLLDASLKAGVRRYIQQSIIFAYPDSGDEWITEDRPLDTSAENARIAAPIIEMEGMLEAIPAERLHWSILRGGMFVGRGTFQEDSLLLMRESSVKIPGDGSNFLSPIHVTDMAAAVAQALTSAPASSIFNIVGEPVCESEYRSEIAAIIGAPPPQFDSGQPRPPSFRCSNAAAAERLGWRPAHGTYEDVPAMMGNKY